MKEATVHAAEVAVHQRDMDAIKKLEPQDFWIRTTSAKKFYPMRPELNVYDINDIAHATAQNNRYNGHLDEPLSVGQHSVLVSRIVERLHPNDPSLALQALLHDATEAYMPDMPSPIKLCLPDFMAMEEKLCASIMQSFKLPEMIDARIEEVDKGIRGSEIKWLFTSLRGDDVWAEDIYKEVITPWPWRWTKRVFLQRFAELDAARWSIGE